MTAPEREHPAAGAWARVRQWLRRPLVARGLQGLVLLACGAYLYAGWQGSQAVLATLVLRWEYLIAGLGLTVAAVWLGAAAWWGVLHAVGAPAPVWPALRTHMAANLAKYVPGFAWQIVGKAVLAQQLGAGAREVSLGLTLEFAALALLGVGLAAAVAPVAWAQRVGWGDLGLVTAGRWLVTAMAWGGAVALLPGLARLWRMDAGRQRVNGPWLASLAGMLVGWLAFGLGFWCLGRGVMPIPLTAWPAFMATLSLSVVIGLAVIFVPSGIGVREAAMVFMLGPYFPPAIVLILATLVRISVALAELISWLTVVMVIKYRLPHR